MSNGAELTGVAVWGQALYWITAVSFVVSLVVTPLARDAFLRRGLVDRPDGGRKLHPRAVPRAGGIPIVVSYVFAYGAGLWICGESGPLRVEHLPLAFRLLPAAAIIFATGLLDDIYCLQPYQKLTGQMAGAAAAVWAGVRISGLAGYPLADPAASVMTIAWLVGCSNAFNLIDGLDGLAAGMGLFSSLTIFVAALLQQDQALALATLPLCGSLLGFLRYNFNPASVFLGDSGSLVIGFLLGCYGIIWSQKAATALSMTAPLLALAVPLLDVALSVMRRWLRGRPIFGADRHHIHHKLLERGLNHRTVVVTLYAACGVYAALSLAATTTGGKTGGLILLLFCAVTVAGVSCLGYFEFGLAGRVVFGGGLRRAVKNEIALHGLRRAMENPAASAFWPELTRAASQFGFAAVRAKLGGHPHHWDSGENGDARWQVRVTVDGENYVNLIRGGTNDVDRVPIGMLVDLIEQGLRRAHRRPSEEGRATVSLLHLATTVERAGQPSEAEPVAR